MIPAMIITVLVWVGMVVTDEPIETEPTEGVSNADQHNAQ